LAEANFGREPTVRVADATTLAEENAGDVLDDLKRHLNNMRRGGYRQADSREKDRNL
jgi:hypothetical protein